MSYLEDRVKTEVSVCEWYGEEKAITLAEINQRLSTELPKDTDPKDIIFALYTNSSWDDSWRYPILQLSYKRFETEEEYNVRIEKEAKRARKIAEQNKAYEAKLKADKIKKQDEEKALYEKLKKKYEK